MSVKLDDKAQWLTNVRRVASLNFDDRPQGVEISLLVIHGISLPPGEFGSSCIEQLFCNALDPGAHPYFGEISELKVSAHLLIDRDGEIIQFVPFHKRAWHAGQSEFNGRENCNDFSIGIELEGADNVDYESAQYETLAQVIKELQRAWPQLTSENIRGHCHISPGRKTDPGPAFDWDRLDTMLDVFPP
ncbi:MAG: 1,6-anhydro-N-acetylmuramyl-L-alanine amidase AmpD [Gammaproteobacteria bacterium]|nr:1,6-anhydro-N-acetylmuramyl-L-alanine amidase AmpD [Gammaproteobacteria bacterium]